TPGNHYIFDTASWKRLPGCFCLPEAYWSIQDPEAGAATWYNPLMCADEWVGAQGWPADRFGFLCGWWNGNFHVAAIYFAGMAKVKVKSPAWAGGYSVYKAEQMGGPEIQQFGTGVPMSAAAAVPPPPPVVPSPAQVNAEIVKLCDSWLLAVGGE